MAYKMTEEEFKLLSDFVRDYAGLVFAGSQEALFHKRVKTRIDANRLKTAREYYLLLRFDRKKDDEIEELINLLTVNETYFFREKPQMEVFANDILPELKERKGGEMRMWSAACSTGAEPFTFAMLIYESGLFLNDIDNIEIIGTDINSRSLHYARKGIYSESAFRTTDDGIRKRHFRDLGGGQWEIKSNMKKMVKYSRLNIFNPKHMILMRNMDIIFFRNALIYFDERGRRAVAEMLYDCLSPKGYLFVGQTENLFKVATFFEIVPMSGVLVYQKPAA